MTALALTTGQAGFAAERVTPIGDRTILRREIPAHGAWQSCRDLLLDAAGDDEITAVGITVPGAARLCAGVIAPAEIPEWRSGFDIVAAVQRTFPVATVRLAPIRLCIALAARRAGAIASDEGLAGAGLLALLAEDYAIRHSPAPYGGWRTIGQWEIRATGPAHLAGCVRRRPRRTP
jgi:hypothetical protein